MRRGAAPYADASWLWEKAFTPHCLIDFEAIHNNREEQKDAEFRDKHNGTLDYGALSR